MVVMKRDISTIAQSNFDMVVIGGGIHGAVIAYELALAGYKTVIIDQNDFSSATSANSFKIIHGGIRYLQDFDIKRMRESIYSRRYFLTNAPHLVKVLPCFMPVPKNSKIKPFMYRTALILNDLISYDRNRGLENGKTIPTCHFLKSSEITDLLPEVDARHFSGAISWHDAVAFDSERLVLDFIQKAVMCGAMAANYLKAEKIHSVQNCVKGIRAKCQLSGQIFDIHTKMVINCTGPWLDEIVHPIRSDLQLKQEHALAMNIVVEPLFSDSFAVGLEGEGGYQKEGSLMKKEKRLFFFVPWHGKTMIGTYYRKYHGSVNDLSIEKDDINAFISQIHDVYPAANITAEKISFYHAGLVPIRKMEDGSNDTFTLKKHTEIIDHDKSGAPTGIISVDSTKYTTAAITAKNLLKYLAKKNTHGEHIRINELPPEIKNFESNNDKTLINHLPLTDEDIQRFIDKEMAFTLSDVVFRRTNLGALECLTDDVLQTIAQRMAMALGWNKEKMVREIEAVKQFILPLKILRENQDESAKKYGS